MTKEEYKDSRQIEEFLKLLDESIGRKSQVSSDKASNEGQHNVYASLSDDIIEYQESIGLFIRKDYFSEFEKGISTTINPEDDNDRVKFILDADEDDADDYEQVFAYSFGPFNASSYFESEVRIIFVDWEPYMLDGDLKKYRTGQIDKLGGCRQSKDFPTYESLEADTHKRAVDLCQMLLSRQSIEKTKDEVMHDHMCILEHNFFPALAFAGNTRSDPDSIGTYSKWNGDILTRLLQFYDGDIVVGCRDQLGEVCSYNGLFNVALSKDDERQEGESTSGFLEWRDKNPTPKASIIGRNVDRTWFNRNLGGKGASALLDDSGTLWIGYVHPASRRGDQWSKTDQQNLADWIYRICKENGLIKSLTA